MPAALKLTKTPKSIKKGPLPANAAHIQYDPKAASLAIAEGLEYLKERLDWSGSKIASVLHVPANTINTWLKKGAVPVHRLDDIPPTIQAIIHLLAIHRSLEAMFDDPIYQREWLATFHETLNEVPEKLMSESIDGLIVIRQYLDYARGRGA